MRTYLIVIAALTAIVACKGEDKDSKKANEPPPTAKDDSKKAPAQTSDDKAKQPPAPAVAIPDGLSKMPPQKCDGEMKLKLVKVAIVASGQPAVSATGRCKVTIRDSFIRGDVHAKERVTMEISGSDIEGERAVTAEGRAQISITGGSVKGATAYSVANVAQISASGVSFAGNKDVRDKGEFIDGGGNTWP